MTVSLPVVLVGDAILIAVGYAWGRGWLQGALAWFKKSKATVVTVETSVKDTVTKVEDQVKQ